MVVMEVDDLQNNLRSDVKILIELANYKERPVTEAEAVAVARQIGAVSYIECSALTQKNLKEVFDTVILTAMHYFNNNNQTGDSAKRSSKKLKLSRTKEQFSFGSGSPSSDAKENRSPGWKKLCCFFWKMKSNSIQFMTLQKGIKFETFIDTQKPRYNNILKNKIPI
jgi:hypothetical protein